MFKPCVPTFTVGKCELANFIVILHGNSYRTNDIYEQLFTVLEKELASAPFLTGQTPTLADIAMYTYTAHAGEGDVSLEAYPLIRQWLSRIEALPGFVPMVRSPEKS